MNFSYDTEWSGPAAALYLSNLCGIDVSFFLYTGRKVDKESYNKKHLLKGCTYLNFFREEHSGCLDEELKMRVLTEYSRENWGRRYAEINDWFFKHKHKCRHIYSPLRNNESFILGGFLLHRFQVIVCLDREKLTFFFILGRIAYAAYYPDEKVFLKLNSYSENDEGVLNLLLDFLLAHPREFATWIKLARIGQLGRAFIVGDNRPGHYIKQSLAFVDHKMDTYIRPFVEKGGIIAIMRDWCFMDFGKLFPELRGTNTLSLASKDAALIMLRMGLDVHRVYRYTTHTDSQWLRDRLGVDKKHQPDQEKMENLKAKHTGGGRYQILISIDAEKKRVTNQVEVCQFVLKRLAEACRNKYSDLHVIWDGWTVAHDPTEKDIRIISEIESIISEIELGLTFPLMQTKIFTMNVEAKIPYVRESNVAMVTQGTGALIPCWLLQCPTITYHIEEIIGDRSCLDENFAYNVPQSAVLPVPSDTTKVPHERRFSLALWGVESALVDAVDAHLPLKYQFERIRT